MKKITKNTKKNNKRYIHVNLLDIETFDDIDIRFAMSTFTELIDARYAAIIIDTITEASVIATLSSIFKNGANFAILKDGVIESGVIIKQKKSLLSKIKTWFKGLFK